MYSISKLQEHNFVYVQDVWYAMIAEMQESGDVHDCMEAGDRAKQEARAEDVRYFTNLWMNSNIYVQKARKRSSKINKRLRKICS